MIWSTHPRYDIHSLPHGASVRTSHGHEATPLCIVSLTWTTTHWRGTWISRSFDSITHALRAAIEDMLSALALHLLPLLPLLLPGAAWLSLAAVPSPSLIAVSTDGRGRKVRVCADGRDSLCFARATATATATAAPATPTAPATPAPGLDNIRPMLLVDSIVRTSPAECSRKLETEWSTTTVPTGATVCIITVSSTGRTLHLQYGTRQCRKSIYNFKLQYG